VPRIGLLERRRRNVVAAPPDLHLRLAVPGGSLRLVEALKRSVVPLVQPPVLRDGQPHLIEDVERDPERADGTLQDGGVREIEDVAALSQEPACIEGFLPSAFG
jgi:hypothetical protein